MAEYRIEYQIHRRDESADEDDFTEIGFGSSGGCGTIEDAAYAIESLVSRGEWETESHKGHPDPEDVLREIREAADR